ncbi:beta-N-acetylhexosaminidase [Sphingomonas morindae]|uniref:beta-N-acetylhexosaminidase n=1 Tax=Sphingomonas morindae TaxID=1541170 RepID=A0ABY4X758_9SPHN|nr:family 20 glycosylhydrolase [Sphingomonas morindae]USI72747.1 family 20 glycosylhydrolase [Sphingomonas morindae]
MRNVAAGAWRIALAGVLAGLGAGAGAALPAAPLPLLPLPAAITPGQGAFRLAPGARIAVPAGDGGAAGAAALLLAKLRTDRALTLAVGDGAGPAAIRFVRDPAVAGAEAYRLRVAADGVEIRASGDSGLLYGVMTLAQLATRDAGSGAATLPALAIADAPRFAWRGVMLDTARHFLPLPAIRAVIDQMAALKLNTLHLHLSDDQGWRMEIKRYPKLTTIGAWRTPPAIGGAAETAAAAPVGGFYRQDELRALVAYAAARGVTIVPEIDLPGHAQALVAAYPERGVLGDRPPVSNAWGINPYLIDPDEQGLAFVEHVLDEVMAIFPSRMIHLGGDEAIKDQWQRAPKVQAQIKALGLASEDALQGWLIGRLAAYLSAHGRQLIGWDEILGAGIPASAAVMSWRGEAGAVAAAGRGHDVVLAPAPTLYLDSLQSARADEGPGRVPVMSLERVYGYDPVPAALDGAAAGHVLGAEMTAFSEYLVTPAALDHALFPRVAALAELSWSPKAARDWPGFLARLQPQRQRWRREGVAAADSAFLADIRLDQDRATALASGAAQLRITTQSGYGTLRYTLDGRAPGPKDRLYTAPIRVPLGRVVRAAAFGPDGAPLAPAQRFDTRAEALLTWDRGAFTACAPGALGLRVPLTSEARDGPIYALDLFEHCVIAPAAPLTVPRRLTVDVARLARNFALAHDEAGVQRPFAATAWGELIVRVKGCDGPIAATLALPDPATAPNRFTLKADLPAAGARADLCLRFTAPPTAYAYAVGTVALSAAAAQPVLSSATKS